MVGMARSKVPSLPVFPTANVVKIPAQVLRGMILHTRVANPTTKESRYTLNGALMVLKPEVITWSHRLAMTTMRPHGD